MLVPDIFPDCPRVKLYFDTIYNTQRCLWIDLSAAPLSRISRDLPINSPINANMITRFAPDRIVFSRQIIVVYFHYILDVRFWPKLYRIALLLDWMAAVIRSSHRLKCIGVSVPYVRTLLLGTQATSTLVYSDEIGRGETSDEPSQDWYRS
jgi:hypothetical protein